MMEKKGDEGVFENEGASAMEETPPPPSYDSLKKTGDEQDVSKATLKKEILENQNTEL